MECHTNNTSAIAIINIIVVILTKLTPLPLLLELVGDGNEEDAAETISELVDWRLEGGPELGAPPLPPRDLIPFADADGGDFLDDGMAAIAVLGL